MPRLNGSVRKTLVCALVALAAPQSAAYATTVTYLTNFTKNNNIYTNLNEQFPNTGPGFPGSEVGTANSTYLFTPTATGVGNSNNVNYANNGISFLLASNATGQDFAQIGQSETFSVGISNPTAIYFLMSAYNGQSTNITLNGTNGATQTFNDINLPDFNGGGNINTTFGGVSDQTVFRIMDTGAGGTGNSTNGAYNNYDLTEVGLTPDSQFNGQTLTSVTVSSNGYETLLLGATALSTSPAAVPEAGTWLMMILGFGLVGNASRLAIRKSLGASEGKALLSAAMA